MRFTLERREGYLHAQLAQRQSAAEMSEFLHAVHAACREHEVSKVLMLVRQSRPAFKPEDYGLDGNMRGYVNALVTANCRVALVGDTPELNAAHEYIEVVARQQNVNVRAFAEEGAALRWLRGAAEPARRYRFTRIVILGAPDDPGVYALWDGEELIYYGRASSIRNRLFEHLQGKVGSGTGAATHYSWELCADPQSREAELLGEYQRMFGRPPRCNGQSA